MNSWSGVNKSFRKPRNRLVNVGNRRNMNLGTEMLARVKSPLRINFSTMSIRWVSLASPRLNLSPPTKAQRMLIKDRLNMALKLTKRFGWFDDFDRMSSINSWISSWIKPSEEVRPKPKSLKWRRAKRRCSCHSGPSLWMTPRLIRSQ